MTSPRPSPPRTGRHTTPSNTGTPRPAHGAALEDTHPGRLTTKREYTTSGLTRAHNTGRLTKRHRRRPTTSRYIQADSRGNHRQAHADTHMHTHTHDNSHGHTYTGRRATVRSHPWALLSQRRKLPPGTQGSLGTPSSGIFPDLARAAEG